MKKEFFGVKKHKLPDKWKETTYTVNKKIDGVLVYDVNPEVRKGQFKRLHRNMLNECVEEDEREEDLEVSGARQEN